MPPGESKQKRVEKSFVNNGVDEVERAAKKADRIYLASIYGEPSKS